MLTVKTPFCCQAIAQNRASLNLKHLTNPTARVDTNLHASATRKIPKASPKIVSVIDQVANEPPTHPKRYGKRKNSQVRFMKLVVAFLPHTNQVTYPKMYELRNVVSDEPIYVEIINSTRDTK